MLLEEWKTVRGSLVPDGLADDAAYLASSLKIVFVMKETNGFDEGDLRDLLRNGGRPQTWTNITRWLLGIRALPADLPWSAVVSADVQRRRAMLRSIGAMNLKKSTGSHATVPVDLWRVAQEDKRFLQRQYEMCDPELTFVVGPNWSRRIAELNSTGVNRAVWLLTSAILRHACTTACFIMD